MRVREDVERAAAAPDDPGEAARNDHGQGERAHRAERPGRNESPSRLYPSGSMSIPSITTTPINAASAIPSGAITRGQRDAESHVDHGLDPVQQPPIAWGDRSR